jgi:hypothetical protein
MKISRRRFLGWIGVTIAAAAGASTLWGRDLRRNLVSMPLPPAPPGPLRDSTADTLRAATLALLEDRVEPRRYVEYFRWRAARVPGARAVYERFEIAVNRAARREGHRGFRSAPRAEQERILRAMLPARGWVRVRRVLLARDEARFAQHVVQAIFSRFAKTDAWILAGYESWPGMPRAIASLRAGKRPS